MNINISFEQTREHFSSSVYSLAWEDGRLFSAVVQHSSHDFLLGVQSGRVQLGTTEIAADCSSRPVYDSDGDMRGSVVLIAAASLVKTKTRIDGTVFHPKKQWPTFPGQPLGQLHIKTNTNQCVKWQLVTGAQNYDSQEVTFWFFYNVMLWKIYRAYLSQLKRSGI